MENLIHSLCTLPATDGNFISALESATKAQIQLAIQMMELNPAGNNTRIEACKRKLKTSDENKDKPKKPENKPKKTENKPKEKEPVKIVNFPGKKPEITKLPETTEKHTYEECADKLGKAKEKYNDLDNAYVIEHLLKQCETDQYLRNNIMRKDKTYDEFIDYMFKAAMAGYCIKVGNTCGILSSEKGFELALDYFNSSDVKNVDKKELEEDLNVEINEIADAQKENEIKAEGITTDSNGQMSFNF